MIRAVAVEMTTLDEPIATEVLPADAKAIERSATLLRSGALVAFPTETVYGLGADASNSAAVRGIFAAKGRPVDHPLIVHLAAPGELSKWAAEIPDAAWKLAEAFWPGPLTLILRRASGASELLTGSRETIGLRVPSHPVARQLLHQFGGAIAAPSANRFGRVSPTCAQHVWDELAGRIPLILDGGSCTVGLESTIVDLSSGRAAVLRPGAVTSEQIQAVLGNSLGTKGDDSPQVSGSLESHYAPQARVEIVPASELEVRAQRLIQAGKKVAVLAGGRSVADIPAGAVLLETPSSDEMYARDLYRLLRQADADGCEVVLAVLPPETGIGQAIADRLSKAAGPRPKGDERP